MHPRRTSQTSFMVAGAVLGLCLAAGPAWSQVTREDGSTISSGGPLDGGSGHSTGFVTVGQILMDNGCIGDGSGWSVSGHAYSWNISAPKARRPC